MNLTEISKSLKYIKRFFFFKESGCGGNAENFICSAGYQQLRTAVKCGTGSHDIVNEKNIAADIFACGCYVAMVYIFYAFVSAQVMLTPIVRGLFYWRSDDWKLEPDS